MNLTACVICGHRGRAEARPYDEMQERASQPTLDLAAADIGNDGDFSGREQRRGEAASVADGFVADEYVDVLANVAVFRENAIAQAGMFLPESFESIAKHWVRTFDKNFTVPASKRAQRSRNVDGDAHRGLDGRRRVRACVFAERFAAFFTETDSAGGLVAARELPKTTLFTHTIGGRPPKIFVHDLPSSMDP